LTSPFSKDAVAVGIAAEHVLQDSLASGLMPADPLQVAGEIELLGHVDHERRLAVHEPAPLTLVEAERVIGSGHGVPRAACPPTRLDPAVRPDGVVALIIEGFRV
jgi:hypothetical protein